MKITAFFTLLLVINQCLLAQEVDTLDTEQGKTSPVIIDDNEDEISVGMDEIIKFDERGDTTRIKIGDKDISIVEDDEGTSVKVTDSGDKKEESAKKKKKFKGHWSGIEFGLNNFVDDKFSMARTDGEQFMDLNTGKSWNFNWNIKQYSIGFGTDSWS